MVPARGVGAGARGHGASDVRRPLPLHLPGDLRGRAALDRAARAPAWPKVVGLAVAELAAHGARRPSCGRTAALGAPEQSLGCLWARQCSPGASSPLRRHPKRRVPLHLATQVPNDAEGPRRAEPPGRSGHAVSLAIKDERRVLAVAEQMVARHIPGLK